MDSRGIFRVPETGGEPVSLAASQDGETLYSPQMLPGGRLLFSRAAGNRVDEGAAVSFWDASDVVVQSTDGSRKTVLKGAGGGARYLPTGHLVYAVGGTVWRCPSMADRRH